MSIQELFASQNRTEDWSIALYKSDGTTGVALNNDDVVRVKVGRTNGADVALDISSSDPTDGNSSVTITSRAAPATFTLRLAQDDLATLGVGSYWGEVSVVDSSETAPANAIKHAQDFVIQISPSLGGGVGL